MGESSSWKRRTARAAIWSSRMWWFAWGAGLMGYAMGHQHGLDVTGTPLGLFAGALIAAFGSALTMFYCVVRWTIDLRNQVINNREEEG